jgi:hypothetical protein
MLKDLVKLISIRMEISEMFVRSRALVKAYWGMLFIKEPNITGYSLKTSFTK